MAYLTLVYSRTPASPAKPTFTRHDLIALTCWKQRADAHGYDRFLLEGGLEDDSPEAGGYVLIYAPGCEWATWGLSRADAEIVVWHCGTGADLGRFATMLDALNSLPPVWTAPVLKHSEPIRQTPRFFVVQSA